MSTDTKGFDWKDLLIGLLYIIAAIALFASPGITITVIVIWLGILAITRGIFNFIRYTKVKKFTGFNATLLIIAGVLNILIGVALITNILSGLIAIGLLFALWFIVDSIAQILNVGFIKANKFIYWLSIIFNVMCLFIGISLLFTPITSALTVPFIIAFYLFIQGIEVVFTTFSK